MPEPAPHIRPLTGLRFVAALLVCLHHMPYLMDEPLTGNLTYRYFSEGFLGVPFFFVLSGFVLAYNYHDRFTRLGRRPLRDYAVARAARIYPVHALTFLMALAYLALTNDLRDSSVGSAALNLSLLHGFAGHTSSMSFNAVSWSLSVEVGCYALLPLLLWGLARVGPRGAAGLVGLAAVAWAGRYAVAALAPPIERDPWWAWFVLLFPPMRLADFLVGVLLARAFLDLRRRGWAGPPRTRRAAWLATALEAGSLVLILSLMRHARGVSINLRFSGAYYLPALALVVFTFAFARGHLSRLLGSRPMVFLGEVSFALYMTHVIVLQLPYVAVGRGLIGPQRPFLMYLPAFLLALALSAAIHVGFEAPLRRRIIARFRPAPPRPATDTAAPPLPRAA
jgi:peptidoglycan/LPS O-acetylase OafA/YrhL